MLGAVLAVVVASGAAAQESLGELLRRGETLAAQKRLDDAERVGRETVRRFPKSRDARLALARVVLWRGRYAEAARRFAELLRSNSGDAEARLGAAQAAYWSGDYRLAARELAEVLRLQPSNAEAARALAEIRTASRAGFVVDAGIVDDDQPFRAVGMTARVFAFSDPLTKWEVSARQERLRGRGLERSAPAIGAAGETALPRWRTSVRGGLTRLRFPDGSARLLPLLRTETRLGTTVLAFAAARRELLRSAASLATHPFADALSVRWSAARFALHAERLRYFDHNRGMSADGYVLMPVTRALSLGASAAVRDTDQSRFAKGTYDPYWTPLAQREARLVGSATFRRNGATFGLHADAGAARDRVTGSFHPWRAGANATIPAAHGLTINIAAERSSTAFYTSNEIRASVAGRF